MNTINEISIISPDNAVESCAEFFIDEPDQAYTLIDTLVDGRKYTFSCWVKALAAGTITAEGETFDITTEWKKIAVSFTANSTQLQIKFSPGTYHMHHPMLETGNKASDWTPNPDDVEQEISLKVGKVDFTGENIISKINLAPGTALIEANHINLRGSVTISDLDDNLGSSFVTDEDGVTQIDGGNIKTGTITALGEVTAGSFDIGSGKFKVSEDGILEATDAIIRGTVYAKDGEFSGTITSSEIKGSTFVSEGTPPTDVLGPDLSLFIAESTLTANSSMLSLQGSNDIESIHTAFGSKYYAEDMEYDTLGDAVLYTSPFGIRYKVRETGASKFTDYFVVDYAGVRWKGSPLVTKKDLSTAQVKSASSATTADKATKAEQDFSGNDIEGTYLKKTDKTTARQEIGIDIGYIERANVKDSAEVIGVAAGGYTDVAITFNEEFTEVPYVYTTLISTSEQSDIGSMAAVPMSRSTTGATIRIYNDSDARREPGVQWVAIGS